MKLCAAMAMTRPLPNTVMTKFEMGDSHSADTIKTKSWTSTFKGVVQDKLVDVCLLQAQILLNRANTEEVKQAFLMHTLTTIELPILSPESTLQLSAGIGNPWYPAQGQNLDELMHQADSVM